MNRETEERFVRTFIIRQQRERLLLELGSPTRRQNGINRFCHDATALVIPQTLACRGKLKREEIKLFLLPHAERGMCYAISSNEAVDGHFFPFHKPLIPCCVLASQAFSCARMPHWSNANRSRALQKS